MGRYGRWRGLGEPTSGRNVQQCEATECQVQTCQNGGTCVDLGASFRLLVCLLVNPYSAGIDFRRQNLMSVD